MKLLHYKKKSYFMNTRTNKARFPADLHLWHDWLSCQKETGAPFEICPVIREFIMSLFLHEFSRTIENTIWYSNCSSERLFFLAFSFMHPVSTSHRYTCCNWGWVSELNTVFDLYDHSVFMHKLDSCWTVYHLKLSVLAFSEFLYR